MKTNELTGVALDWAVALCKGLLEAGHVVVDFEYMSGHDPIRLNPLPEVYYSPAYTPSTDWAQGGPIIEREYIQLTIDLAWEAHVICEDKKFGGVERFACTGPTPLIAAMRCFVASHLGDEIELPEELK